VNKNVQLPLPASTHFNGALETNSASTELDGIPKQFLGSWATSKDRCHEDAARVHLSPHNIDFSDSHGNVSQIRPGPGNKALSIKSGFVGSGDVWFKMISLQIIGGNLFMKIEGQDGATWYPCGDD